MGPVGARAHSFSWDGDHNETLVQGELDEAVRPDPQNVAAVCLHVHELKPKMMFTLVRW